MLEATGSICGTTGSTGGDLLPYQRYLGTALHPSAPNSKGDNTVEESVSGTLTGYYERESATLEEDIRHEQQYCRDHESCWKQKLSHLEY